MPTCLPAGVSLHALSLGPGSLQLSSQAYLDYASSFVTHMQGLTLASEDSQPADSGTVAKALEVRFLALSAPATLKM
jgi:hypothetical protein